MNTKRPVAVPGEANARGFSLMETLVMALLAVVLAAIAYPVYQTGVAGAKSTGCVSNLRQIGIGLFAYASDHRQYLPPTTRVYTPPLDGKYDKLFWTALVAPYLGLTPQNQPGQIALRCPERGTFDPEKGANYTYGISLGKAAHTDELVNGSVVPGSYYANGFVKPLPALGRGTFIVGDCDGRNRPQIYWPGSRGSWRLTVDRGETGIPDSSGALAGEFNEVKFAHRRRANFLRADGSVVSLSVRQWAENEGNVWGDFGER